MERCAARWLVSILFALSFSLPAAAASVAKVPFDPECAADCAERARALAEECIAAGNPIVECKRKAHSQTNVCLLERCEPGKPPCEERCAARAAAFYVRCKAAGEPMDACRERAARVEAACIDEYCADCVCPDVFDPVCGADGMTYGNACEAQCAGVRIVHEGECDDRLCKSDEDCEPGSRCVRRACDVECRADDSGDAESLAACERNCIGVCVDCVCPDIWAPVCGVDGETYGNACEARCAGVEIESEGECPVRCEPLACDLACPNGFKTGPDGCPICECNEGCICPLIADPVCGVDGNTYSNPCFARCAGVEVAYKGACREQCFECRNDDDCSRGEICDGLGQCIPAGECARRGFTPETCARVLCAPTGGDPVCGNDGKTYPNPCIACCVAGVEIDHPGRCEEPCVCPDIYDPVCGVDGQTWSNRCYARCAGVEVAHPGPCRDGCRSNDDCPATQICYPPTAECRPPCQIDCFRYDPVCGTDNVTYACGAEDAFCHGARVAHEGECGTCFSDQDCSAELRCNAPDLCLPPPGCVPGEPCLTVCAGHCVPRL